MLLVQLCISFVEDNQVMVSNIVIFSSLMTNILESFDSTHVASRHQTLTFAPEFLVTRVCVTQCTNVFVTKIRIERPCLPSFLSKDNMISGSKYRSKSNTQQILGYHQHTPHVSQGLEAPTPKSQKDGSST